MPECIVIFPDGVRVVPLLLPGTVEIAEASAGALEHSRVISWSHHGIFVSEESPNKIFALVETIEKAAAIHRKVLVGRRAEARHLHRDPARTHREVRAYHGGEPEWLDDA